MYECAACGTRYLGEQRCPECQQFCRRIGPGGACPHCDEPVALADLLDASGGTEGPSLDGKERTTDPAPIGVAYF